jgi:hypothetical protein
MRWYRQPMDSSETRKAMIIGLLLGLLMTFPALFFAAASAGAGHGGYVAARAIFPFSMLLTLAEGNIGPIALAIALIQLPIYGAICGRVKAHKNYRPVAIIAFVHLVAALVGFAGTLPNYS